MFSSKKRKAVDNSKDEALENYFSKSIPSLEILEKREAKERLQFEATFGEFSLWADDYFTKDKLNAFVGLYDAVAQFRKDTPYKWNVIYFKDNLEKWCEAKKYEINPPESIGESGRCHDDLVRGHKPAVFIKPINTGNNG